MEQLLEQVVDTFLKTPRAFRPSNVLGLACLLLAEQGFKLSGMHDSFLAPSNHAGMKGTVAMLLQWVGRILDCS